MLGDIGDECFVAGVLFNGTRRRMTTNHATRGMAEVGNEVQTAIETNKEDSE